MGRFPYSFDRVAAVYDVTRALPAEAIERIVSTIAEVGSGGRILEVGVGTGRLALPLQRAGHVLVGTDVSRKMMRIGRRKGLYHTIRADAEHLPFAEGCFEVAMTNRVLHLLPHWREALGEICRVTREAYLSVIERESADPDLETEYNRLVARSGGDTKRPGIYERELVERLAPDQRTTIGAFRGTESTSRAISRFQQRVFSGQWYVAERDHQSAISALRERHDGGRVNTRNEVELAIWRIDRLRDFSRT